MKEHNKELSNIIPFPNLEERLLQKGLEALQNKKFKEATIHLTQALEMDPENSEFHLALVICLFESGELEEALAVCKKMLQEDKGDYFNVLQIYLTILIQLGHYEEVTTAIEAVLEEDKLPAEYAETYYKLLDFSRKMQSPKDGSEKEEDIPADFAESLSFRLSKEAAVQEQLEAIRSLQDINIRKYLEIVLPILAAEDRHPVLKSILLQLLMENEIDKRVIVEKFGREMEVVPYELKDIADQEFTKNVLSHLEDFLAQENPTLFEMVKELWLRHMLVMFPFLPEPPDARLWAAGLLHTGMEFLGTADSQPGAEQLFGVDEADLEKICGAIRRIEEISYLQL